MNLCMPPSSVTSWPFSSGNWRTRSSKTSPNVAPLALTDACPPACWRRTVGSRTSTGMPSMLPAVQLDGLLVDRAVDDAIGAQDGFSVLEGHEHVVPRGVGCLVHVRRRG